MSAQTPTRGSGKNGIDAAEPVNPVNGDTITTKEEEAKYERPLVKKVVGTGRIAPVGSSTDFAIADTLARGGLSERIKFRREVGWLGWDGATGRWTSDDVALSSWLGKWIETLRHACECGGVSRGSRGGSFCPCDHARRLEGTRTRSSILDMAMTIPAFRQDAWDQDPFIVPAANGIVDIRDLTFRRSMPGDFITVSAPTNYDPLAQAPRWQQFVEEIQPEPEVRDFLQKALGSGLTRSTRDQLFYFLLGQGANGKGVLQRACHAVLGDLFGMAPSGLFVRRSDESANRFCLARLVDRRLIFASEVPNGRALDEYTVKQLTGEDLVVVEEKFQPQQQARLVGTVMMTVNELPRIFDHTHALRRRLRVIPFLQTFAVDNEPNLEGKLAAEASGILNWLIRGAHLWYKENGPGYPESIRQATETALRESFQLYDFLAEVLVQDAAASVRASVLRDRYTDYARSRGLRDRMSNREFGDAVASFMGGTLDKADNNGLVYRGWRLKEPVEG